MVLRKRPLAAGVAALVLSSWVAALGLGDIELHSALNEPLDAEIRLLNLGELTAAEIIAGLAPAAEFSNAGIVRESILSELVFSLDLANSARPLLRVSSQQPIREPYLDFLVDVQWPAGRLLREYTLLLDLPVYASDQRVRSSPVTTTASDVTWQDQQVSAQPATRTASGSSVPAARHLPPMAGGDQYQVGGGETLWSIASRLSGDQSVYDKMVAIHQLNPSAFINGDINLLREGQILRLPDSTELADAAALPAYPQGDENTVPAPRFGAASAPARSDSTAESPAGRLRLSAIDPDTVNENESLAATLGAEAAADREQIRGELQGVQDELARTERENRELKTRLTHLEDQVTTLQRLLELSSDDLYSAQQAAAGQQLEDSGRAASPLADAELTAHPSADTETVAAEADADAVPTAESSNAAEQGAVSQTKIDKGWLATVNSYLVYIVGGLAVLIIALVVAVLRKRRRDEDDEPVVFAPQAPAAPLVVAPPVESGAAETDGPEPAAAESAAVESTGIESGADDTSLVGEQSVPPSAAISSLDEIVLDEDDDFFASTAPADIETETVSDASAQPTAATPVRVEESLDEIELDLAEFDLDEFELDELAEQPADPAAQVSTNLDEALNLDDFDFLGDADEGETQLGLAQAYIDMGDYNSAREILQEVAESGSEAHQVRARSLLEGLR